MGVVAWLWLSVGPALAQPAPTGDAEAPEAADAPEDGATAPAPETPPVDDADEVPTADDESQPPPAPAEVAPPPAATPAPSEDAPSDPANDAEAAEEPTYRAAPTQASGPGRNAQLVAPVVQAVSEPAGEPEPSGRAPRLVLSPSVFSRYELRRGYDALGVGNARFRDFDAVAYRARLELAIERIALGDHGSLDIVITPQSSGFWAPSGVLADAPLSLHEGYLRPRFGEASWLQVGRFEMAYGEDWLIGAVGWHETGRSFDGGRLHVQPSADGAWVDLFFNALREGRSGDLATTANDRIAAGDTYLLGAYLGLGAAIAPGTELDLYALALLQPGTDELQPDDGSGPTGRDGAAEITLGGRAKGGTGRLGYRVEGGLQAGTRSGAGGEAADVLAGAADVEASVRAHDKLRLALEGLYASGDDPDTERQEGWADRFSTAHKWLGLSDVMGTRTNVMGGVFHATASATDALTLGLQLHAYARPRRPDEAGYYGTELDVFAAYALLQGLSVRADYDVFLPAEDAFGPGADPVHYLGVHLRYDGSASVALQRGP